MATSKQRLATGHDDLRLLESLLASEVDTLGRYNRLLETELGPVLFDLLSRMRDDTLRRIDVFQERIRTAHAQLEGAL